MFGQLHKAETATLFLLSLLTVHWHSVSMTMLQVSAGCKLCLLSQPFSMRDTVMNGKLANARQYSSRYCLMAALLESIQ